MAMRILTIDVVLELHAQMIEAYGGSTGVRDVGLLDSALAMPQAAFGGQYVHESLAEMAGAYLFYLCKNHAFIDGNKRVAALAAIVFLDLNGVEIKAPEDAFEAITLAVASGQANKEDVTAFFRKYIAV